MPEPQAADTGSRLLSWCTGDYRGRTSPGTLDIVVTANAEPTALLDTAADLGLHVGPETMVFWPDGLRPDARLRQRGAQLSTYEGSVYAADEDDLLVNGTVPLASVAYGGSPYLPVTGPTVLRITEPADYLDFLVDADRAVTSGMFTEHLTHPLVRLGDTCALAGHLRCHSARRRRALVAEAGLTHSAYGEPITPEPSTTLPSTGCPCVRAIHSSAQLNAERAARPWLSRYVEVLGVLAALRAQAHAPADATTVSGFGTRLTAVAAAVPTEAAGRPVIVCREGETLICDPTSLRVMRVSDDVARASELMLASDTIDRAELTDQVAAELAVESRVAADALVTVYDTLIGMGCSLPALSPG